VADSSFLRQLALLQLIPSHPRALDTTQLASLLAADGFECTSRTVQRDLLALERYGVGVERIDDSKPFRWRYAQGTRPRATMKPDQQQALALLVVEAHLKRLMPRAVWSALLPQLDAARAALAGKPGRRLVESIRVVPRAQPLLPPAVDVVVLDAVHNALVERTVVRVRYDGVSKSSELDLHVHGLVVRDVVTYVIATAGDYDDVRQYALHRIRRASSTTTPARRAPAGFDLDAYVDGGNAGWRLARDPIALELAFFFGAERVVVESPLAADQQTRVVGDAVHVTATVADTRVLRAWILGFGANVEVKKPRALRSAIADTAARLGKIYT